MSLEGGLIITVKCFALFLCVFCVFVFSLAPHILFLCLFGDEEEEHSHHHMPSGSAQSGIDKVDAFLPRPVRPELCSPSCIQRTLACL